ncbi:MAG: polysaccharide deacetylase family protein [Planctomycetota bacterium]|jgi:peptidoglycan/xylan/chitin deacetylase (PgdA/CDA1 family)
MKQGVTVLMYHALSQAGVFDIKDMNPADRGYTLPADFFEQQLQQLEKSKVMVSIPAPIVAEVSTIDIANAALPTYDGSFMITFDDSWESHLTVALPLLEKYSCKGMFFLTVEQIGKSNMLSEKQIRELTDKGAVIGAHGVNHRYFNDLDSYQLRNELAGSRKALSDITGKDIHTLALPGGRGHPDLKEIAIDEGYTHIFGSCPGVWKGKGEILPRVPVTASMSPELFSVLIEKPGLYLFKKRVMFKLLKFLRIILGNDKYDKLRAYVRNEDNEM